MLNLRNLIGKKKEDAVKILTENGYNDIEVIINSKSNDLTDSVLVCKAEKINEKVVLVCGEFYLNIKG